METRYNPHLLEKKCYQSWEHNGYFPAVGEGTPYCIMIPPPNVTGSLHMGHAFQYTLMDALIRYHRMNGDRSHWQMGMDHAGIATQMVVERQLNAEGQTRHDLGRSAFIKQVWQWKSQSGGTIAQQLRRMGASVDWSRERFTLDDGLSEAVREVFVRLYEEGLIYKGKRLVNWDPVLHTAVSDLEVFTEEKEGHLWHMQYLRQDGQGSVVVATTRPETLLGDAAIAVHPDDSRYQNLVGQQVHLPLTNRSIPVITDFHVDPKFGTGCVKITPAHDFNDYTVWQRHKDSEVLACQPRNGLINIFTIDASIQTPAGDAEVAALIPAAYHGLDRYEARRQILADLAAIGQLVKTEKHRLKVPIGDRSHTVIEPFLTDQWYVRAEPLAKPAIAAVEQGKIRFVPDHWKNTYFEWMRNIQDWCISRQLWWGHRIPAWYDADENCYVGRNEAEVREKYSLAPDLPLEQDQDVLDTWFSSALWPFSTLGWPHKTTELQHYYPTNVLVTGFDIIFFWVARMVMMGLKFMEDVPFREVYIHGLVRDSHGQKMSKAKGNIIDPIDLIDGIELEPLVAKRITGLMQPEMAPAIEQAIREDYPQGFPAFGTDALRFTFAAMASTGRDINFNLNRIEGYRNFCNKLWNAARFVVINTQGQDNGCQDQVQQRSLADRWILSRLQRIETEIIKAIKDYRFDLVAQAIYEFSWNEYCDWYLELAKTVLQDKTASSEAHRTTRQTLLQVLETLLRLAHPIIPYITETIWQRIAPLAGCTGDTIMRQRYPEPDSSLIDVAAEGEMHWVQTFVLGVRRIRGEYDISPGKAIPALLQGGESQDQQWSQAHARYLQVLARLASIEYLVPGKSVPESATALVGGMKILIPMKGLIDQVAEEARLDKEIQKQQKDLDQCQKKLATPKFVERAPEAVVAKERNRVNSLISSISKLQEQKEQIQNL